MELFIDVVLLNDESFFGYQVLGINITSLILPIRFSGQNYEHGNYVGWYEKARLLFGVATYHKFLLEKEVSRNVKRSDLRRSKERI